MERPFSRRLAGIVAIMALAVPAAHAATTGNIEGRVTDARNGKPLPGVTVVASGPQGEQTEFTDSNGHYIITDLPPGEYVVRFFYSNLKIERPGVIVDSDKTLSIGAAVPTAEARTQTFHITERAPTVDVATSQVQTQITDELVRSTPVGRTYGSVLTLAPGATTDRAGVSFNGATGPENQFLIDGMNTTNPAYGLLGTPLTLEFIKQTEIITGGYNAEFGRATGGIVNVVTKSGTNELHGGAWFFYTPFQVDPLRVGRPGEAIAFVAKEVDHAFDFGFDLGGPILKNRLWFYGGFASNFTTSTYDRIIRARTADQLDVGTMSGTYAGDPDTSIACPAWLSAQSPALCEPSKAGSVKTVDLDRRYWRRYESNSRLYNAIAKLTLRINDNNHVDLTYIASPSTFQGVYGNPRNPVPMVGFGFNGNPNAMRFDDPMQVHDLVLHYVGKFAARRLQLDVLGGLHYESSSVTPLDQGNAAPANFDTRTMSLATFESSVSPCAVQNIHGVTFNPCPVSNYRDGGLFYSNSIVNQRLSTAAGLTYFVKFIGTHALKLGGDFEWNQYQDHRAFPGGGRYFTFGDGSVDRVQFATVDQDGRVIVNDGTDGRINGYTATTNTLNESLYLRDSWSLGFLPGFTLNLGVRWEAQQLRGMPRADPIGNTDPGAPQGSHTEIGIYDNWAPRLGFAYDFTRKGRSKLYASYGRFYESIPLDINDRLFSGEGVLRQYVPASACMADANGRVDTSTCQFPAPVRSEVQGGTFGTVSPVLKGQYSNEVVAGLQYDVGYDIVLGATYIHRDLGRVIEDVSPDGMNYIIANPGESPDLGTVNDLQSKINDLDNQIKSTTDMARVAALTKSRDQTIQQLALYKGASKFEKPRRDYNAVTLMASKRLSHNFIVLASYTYSRTLGNYDGLYQGSTGQLDPNITTQYDLPELLLNRNGPLPNDRPHNFKLTGAYHVPLGGAGGLTLGGNFSAISGTPIEVLGRHPLYGANQTFILPRGSGGRTPTVTQLDLRIAYTRQFGKTLRAELSVDLFNVLNQQQVVAVDPQYTADRVLPILNGTYDDLKNLKTTSGTTPRLNPNFGQPIAYQAPFSMRIGARISF